MTPTSRLLARIHAICDFTLFASEGARRLLGSREIAVKNFPKISKSAMNRRGPPRAVAWQDGIVVQLFAGDSMHAYVRPVQVSKSSEPDAETDHRPMQNEVGAVAVEVVGRIYAERA